MTDASKTDGLPRSAIRVATLTVSDTRGQAADESGRLLREMVVAAGFSLADHRIVPDERQRILGALDELSAGDLADVVISTGGTGIAARDVTIEVVESLLDKKLDGFGEAFRRLSWDAVGPRAVLSRAVAGTYRGRLIAALPGSPRAVELARREVLLPLLDPAVGLLRGRPHQHGGSLGAHR
jgi:molybdenum cofactor biosynthesis protein B